MVDRFRDGLLTPTETASYLEIPQSTLTSCARGRRACDSGRFKRPR